jgi:hypothetical protein
MLLEEVEAPFISIRDPLSLSPRMKLFWIRLSLIVRVNVPEYEPLPAENMKPFVHAKLLKKVEFDILRFTFTELGSIKNILELLSFQFWTMRF